MSDFEERRRVDSMVRAVEQHLGRKLTTVEMLKLATILRPRPNEWMRAWVERQGTEFPDFAALYGRKAELDGEA